MCSSNLNRGHRESAVARPGGFTLIELIVVMGVIALLLGSALLVMGNVLQSAREKATRATIFKINGMVEQKMDSINRYFDLRPGRAGSSTSIPEQRKKTKAFLDLAWQTSLTSTNPPPLQLAAINHLEGEGNDAWTLLNRLRMIRESFPQSFVDICGGDRAPGTPSDDNSNGTLNFYSNGFPDVAEFLVGSTHNDYEQFARVLKAMGTQGLLNPQTHDPATESIELLYLALTEVDSVGSAPIDQAQFTSAEVKDTDGDGLLEFVDGWGKPLRFYRWPTRLLRSANTDNDPNGTIDAAGYDAPPDPTYASLLLNNLPSQSVSDLKPNLRDTNDSFRYIRRIFIERTSSVKADQDAYTRNFEYWFYTPDTFHSFLIVSAGPDGQLGLSEPNQVVPTPLSAASVMGHLAQPIKLGPIEANDIVDNVTNKQK